MTLKDLLDAGLLREGDELNWNRRRAKKTHKAIISKAGQIITEDGIRHKTPSGAAKHLNNNKPIDGWLAWKKAESHESLALLRLKIQRIVTKNKQ